MISYTQSPANVSTNLSLWLKADNNGGIVTDGDALLNWIDQSMAGHDGLAMGTSTFENDVTNLINYNPVVNFISTNFDRYDFANSTMPSGNQNYNCYVVFTSELTSDINTIFFSGTNDMNKWFRTHVDADGSVDDRFNQTGNNNGPAGTVVANQQIIINHTYHSALDKKKTFSNGKSISTTTYTGTHNGQNINHSIGCNKSQSNKYFNGNIAELIVFQNELTAVKRQQVDSYLAIKYGITIDNSNGGTAGDYISSDGSTVTWDASLSPTYHNDIIGLSRDDISGFNQKQSHTLDDSSRIYIDDLQLRNSLNTGSFVNDQSYLLMGNNKGMVCATAASITEIPLSCGYLYSRLEREWKVTKTDFDQTFNCDLVLNSCANITAVDIADLRVLIDDDGDFSNGGTNCYESGDGSGIVISYNSATITLSNLSNTHIANNSTKYLTIGSVNVLTPLPVELINFSAIPNGPLSALISWKTASELNNDYFTVQHSKDGEIWKDVSKVEGIGNSTTTNNYSIIDPECNHGINYYRLKQVDFNGTYEYSTIEKVIFDKNEILSLHPNPTSLLLNINVALDENNSIYTCLGQNVWHQIKVISQSKNHTTLDVSNLSPGIYIIKTSNRSARFIVE